MQDVKTYQEFNSIVEEHQQVLVYFTAKWCGPCQSFSPVMNKVSDAFGNLLKTIKVDVDSISEASVDFKVRSVPTVLLLKNGAPVEGMIGSQSYEKVSRWVMSNVLVY